jgi:hypothetical protein
MREITTVLAKVILSKSNKPDIVESKSELNKKTPNKVINAQKIPITLGPILTIIGILVSSLCSNLLKRI